MPIVKSNKNWPLMISFIFIFLFFIFIGFSLFQIQYSNSGVIVTHNPTISILEAPRGNILSEDGRILSVTMPVYDVRLDLKTIDNLVFNQNITDLSVELSRLFNDKTAEEYKQELISNKQKRYYKLKKDVSYLTLQEMKKFPIFNLGKYRGGFIYEIKSTREYPFGSLGKVTIGRVDIENDSIIPKNGIEKAFNFYLQGVPGKQLNQEISGKMLIPKESEKNILPISGKDVVTTINIEFQDAAESSLRKKLMETKAKWGTVVLMEVETGNVKAIANLHRSEDSSKYFDSKNHAIVSEIAPGSTFKLASFLSLLEDGFINLEDSINTGNGNISFYGSTINDTRKHGVITLGDAFVVSSNVAISKAINENYKNKPELFYSNLTRFGLTEPLELQLPYRSSMLVRNPSDKYWSGTTLPSMSIGYEMKLSPMQILCFYNSIANDGKMVIPKLVSAIKDETGIIEKFPSKYIDGRVCSIDNIKMLMPYMEQVVSNQKDNDSDDKIYGTASNIYTNKYSIAGKTGTCKNEYWNWDKKTKYERSYTASFAGFFPVENPKYSCIVVIHDFVDPTDKNHYAGIVAAPVFKDISDKVYSFDSNLSEYYHNTQISEDTTIKFNKLIKIKESSDIRIQSIFEQLSNKMMPNLTGINLMDLIYVLENSDLIFDYDGSGKVTYQSIEVGDPILEEDVIKIKLL